MQKTILLALFLVICTSCATQKIPVSPALHKFQAVESFAEDYALLYIYYPYTEVAHNGIYNTSVTITLDIDSQKIIQMPNKGYTWIELKPGPYTLSAEWTKEQGITNPAPISTDIKVAAGNTYYLRISHTGKTRLGPAIGGHLIGLPHTIMEDITADFELETDFSKTGLPWCNYSKSDIAKWPQ